VGAQRPFGEAKHSERRCSEANRRRCARIDPGAKEPRAPASGPHAGASLLGYFFLGRHSGRLEKVTRRKGGTLISNTRLRVRPLAVSLLQRVTFSKRRKGNPKGFAPAYGTSLRLSVPSLRCPSGGIAYGLLRCTSSRCVRLRRTALRAYPPDEHLRSACRRGKKARSKARSRTPHPSPLPEGEGTDRGVWARYADV